MAKDERIAEELASQPAQIPLEVVFGKEAFQEIINSDKYRYVGNNKCRLCHRQFFIGRNKDKHAFAMKSIVESGHQKDEHCLSCHTTGFGIKTGFISIERTPRLANVQCEGCHGPGNVHVSQAKELSRSGKKEMVHGLLVGIDHPERLRKMCKACHTERWNRSYEDMNQSFKLYRNPDPLHHTTK